MLDFAAALPSISQQFLRQALLRETALKVGRRVALRMPGARQGAALGGFDVTGSVRLGCPVSPLLFVAAMDSLIRHAQRQVPGAAARAFADDTEVALQLDDLRPLWEILFQLNRAMGLCLSVKKTRPRADRRPRAGGHAKAFGRRGEPVVWRKR